MTKFNTISLYLAKIFLTQSFALASSVAYSEIRQNFSNSVREEKEAADVKQLILFFRKVGLPTLHFFHPLSSIENFLKLLIPKQRSFSGHEAKVKNDF